MTTTNDNSPSARRRRQRRGETRDKLLATARQLMAEGGKFTIELVARGAGISVGAFYLNFESDRQLYAELLRHDIEDHRAGVDDAGVLSLLAKYLSPEMRAVLAHQGFIAADVDKAA